jgi:hypothetical protein
MIFLLLALILLFFLQLFGRSDKIWDAAIGLSIAYVNSLAGLLFICWGYNKSQNKFLGAVYASIIFRFLLIFSLLFILIGVLNFEALVLILTLCISYFSFMGLEIYVVNKNANIEVTS